MGEAVAQSIWLGSEVDGRVGGERAATLIIRERAGHVRNGAVGVGGRWGEIGGRIREGILLGPLPLID